jgi:aspartate aminotransferase
MPALAERLGRAEMTPLVRMTTQARAMRAQGIDVISLTIGEPDFAAPAHAIEAMHAAALGGETKYTPFDGTRALKEAVQRKFRRDAGLDFALDQIAVGNGGKQVIYNAIMATVDPGDEVVIPSPYWTAYSVMAELATGRPVFVSCPQNNGFKPRPEDIEAAITPRTKWLLLNFPNNPTGAACSAEELGAIAAVLRRHPDVWVLCDDMYEHLVYNGFALRTLASVAPDLRDRVLTVSGVSKTYAMTGFRVGFAGGPQPLIRAMVTMQGHATSGVSSVAQAAAAAALDGPQHLVAERAAIYRHRRDLVVDALNACAGITCHRPEGAFYVFPCVAGCLGRTTPCGRRIETDADFAQALLEEAHVATVHGGSFGMAPYLRISYATDEAALAKACERIALFCERLS